MSYTTFGYAGLKTSATTSTFSVTNTGNVAGAEIVQFYVGFPASAGLPPKQLKGFKRVELAVGETNTVIVSLTPADLSIYNVVEAAWVPVSGEFRVFVGASAADIMLKGSFTV